MAVLAVVAALVAVALVGPTSSFTVGRTSHASNVAVVNGSSAIVGLDPASSVPTGSTSRALTLQNRLNRSLNTTVSLVGGGDATLTAGGSNGTTVSTTLAPGESRDVNADVRCGSGDLRLRVTGVNRSFRVRANRTVPTTAGCTQSGGRALVYTNASGYLRTLAGPNSTPTGYGVTASAVGPASVDFDGDGENAVPYSPSGSALRLADGTGTQSLNGTLYGTPSRLWEGDWNGTTAVYYANASKDIAGVRPSGQPRGVATTKAKAVVGAADVTGDGTPELVFVGGSQQLHLLDGNGTTTKTSASAATTNAVGSPADFNGNGRSRVPVVDGSNNLQLVSVGSGGSVTETKLAGGVAKTGVATLDWDGDGAPEVLYVGNTNDQLHYVDNVSSSPTTHNVTVNGSAVTVSTTTGVA